MAVTKVVSFPPTLPQELLIASGAIAGLGLAWFRVPGGKEPVQTREDIRVGSQASISETLTGDELCTRSHTNLVATTIVPYHNASSMCAMSIAICWNVWIGTGGIPPVVVMIRTGAIPTSIMILFNGRVIPLEPRVLIGQDDTLTSITPSPNLVCFDKADITAYSFGCVY